MIGIIGRLRLYVNFFAWVHALICSFRNLAAPQLFCRMICPASQRLLHHNGKETIYRTLLDHMNSGSSSQSIDLAIMSMLSIIYITTNINQIENIPHTNQSLNRILSIQAKRGPRILRELIKSKNPPALWLYPRARPRRTHMSILICTIPP